MYHSKQIKYEIQEVEMDDMAVM